MENEIRVTLENNFVQVISNGDKNYKHVCEVWSKTTQFCLENDCFKILGIAKTTNPISSFEAYDHTKLFLELGISDKFKIAWVELNSKFKENIKFVEFVLNNRGFPGKVFDQIDTAKNWLLDDNAY